MKNLRTLLFWLLVVMATALPIRADVIVDNLTQPTRGYFGPIGNDASTNDFWIGQQFTVPNGPTPYALDKITLALGPQNGGASVTLSLWQSGPNDSPTNEIPINEIAVVNSAIVTNSGNVDFAPTNTLVLTPGTYFAVIQPTTAGDSGYVNWAYSNTTNWTGTGVLGGYADTTGGGWYYTAITNYPQQMRVQATPIPANLSLSQQTNQTILAWPAGLTGYVLDTTTNLAAPNWQLVTNIPAAAAGMKAVTNQWNDPARYFRLHQSLVVNNLDQLTYGWDGPIGTDNNTNDFLIGQEFNLPAGNYSLYQVTMRLNPVYGLGNITASLWQVGANQNPTTQVAVLASQLVLVEGNVNFVPAAPVPISGGTYCIVVAPKTASDNGLVGWDWTLSLSWTGFGALTNYADTYSGAWENLPLSNGPFQLSIQVLPQP